MVGGVLYFNTPLSQGVAVDAKTGETLWVFNPKSYEEGTTTMTGTWRQRGVAYWTDGEGGRAHLLGHGQRLRRVREGKDRAAVRRLRPRRQRHGRRDGRPPRAPPAASATT